ncbi:MAG: pyridoxal-phosphate dependent enzyme [Pseudomonadales bacterium]
MDMSIALQSLETDASRQAGVSLFVLRLDLIDTYISGNKWFKLQHNLAEAAHLECKGIASFGGMWSNHLHALAAIGKQRNVPTMGIVRGHDHGELTATLQDCRNWGMQLHFVGPTEYRELKRDHSGVLQSRFGGWHVVPEGGANSLGVKGCEDIGKLLADADEGPFDEVLLPVGTGATLAGLAVGLGQSARISGISVLKGAVSLAAEIQDFIAGRDVANWQLLHDYHHGGYGRLSRELAFFITDFVSKTGIPLEPVYSGKLFFAAMSLIEQGYFARGSRIVLLHTGGLQGLRGMQARMDSMLRLD